CAIVVARARESRCRTRGGSEEAPPNRDRRHAVLSEPRDYYSDARRAHAAGLGSARGGSARESRLLFRVRGFTGAGRFANVLRRAILVPTSSRVQSLRSIG